MPTIADAIARIDSTLTRRNARADAEFSEADHPRANNGQFGSGGGGGKPKAAKSKGVWGSIKEAFSGSESNQAEGRLSKAKYDFEEAEHDAGYFTRLAREAKGPERAAAEAKAVAARKAADKAASAFREAKQHHDEAGPQAEAKREADRKAEEDRYWASRRGPHPLDKVKSRLDASVDDVFEAKLKAFKQAQFDYTRSKSTKNREALVTASEEFEKASEASRNEQDRLYREERNNKAKALVTNRQEKRANQGGLF